MNGLLIIDKPQGLSSHDVVARARRMLREKRIGHAGTLDPMATGVLVLCVGQATRLSEYLLGEDKAYEGLIKLGERTNTDDAEGEVIATRPVPAITDAMLRALEAQFSGEIEQVPPQFSAIQKGGQRAYALARKGETVELAARRVVMWEIHLAQPDDGRWTMDDVRSAIRRPSSIVIRVRCGAGTYIRSLARDIGEALGCGGHLIALRRTQSGHFTLGDAVTLEQLEAASKAGAAQTLLLPMDRAVADWPAVQLDEAQANKIRHGQVTSLMAHSGHKPLALSPNGERELVRVYDARRNFIAVARWDGTTLVPVKVFDIDATPPLV
jgi:tRNA pseudouridine55 synthase